TFITQQGKCIYHFSDIVTVSFLFKLKGKQQSYLEFKSSVKGGDSCTGASAYCANGAVELKNIEQNGS
ncbi:hypothetical protein ACGTN9_20910, partial [Halobacillus sp. MO56]